MLQVRPSVNVNMFVSCMTCASLKHSYSCKLDSSQYLFYATHSEVMQPAEAAAAEDDAGSVAAETTEGEEDAERYPRRERRAPIDPYAAYINFLEDDASISFLEDNATILNLAGEDNPRTLAEAFKRDDAQLWKEAYHREMQALREKRVFTVVRRDQVPPGTRILQSRIVAVIKRDEKGDIKEYKVRIVAKGFMQKEGVDFTEISAPTVKAATVHMVLAYAMNKKYGIRQIDVRTAFLNGESYGRLGASAQNFLKALGDLAASRGNISKAAFVRSAYREISCALQKGNGMMYDRSLFQIARASGRQFMPGCDVPVQEEALL